MWHTSQGDRTLRGSEARLVGKVIDQMIDALLIHVNEDFDDEEPADTPIVECDSGIMSYDALSAGQRIALLHDVAKHLLTNTPRTIDLSSTLEATVAAIFIEIRDQVAIEISLCADWTQENDLTWRQLVLDAYLTICGDDPELRSELGIPHVSSTDVENWELLVDGLTDAILWDRDFEMADSFMDIDPNVSHHRRRLLGIDDDYFISIAPDPAA